MLSYPPTIPPALHPPTRQAVFFFFVAVLDLFLKFIFLSIFKIYYFWLRGVFIALCLQAFSSCGEWGLLFVAARGLLTAVASLVAGARALGTRAQ